MSRFILKICTVINMTITLVRTCIIYIFIVLAVKIMGKRQIGQLKPHELIITFLVSQIASQPLQDNSIPLVNAIMPILLLVSFEIIFSVISMKSIRFRDFVQGKPIFVIRDGKIKENELRRLRLTGDDLIDAMRQKDVFDLSTVKDAVMETNGTISVLQRKECTPPDAQTLNVQTTDGGCPVVIVLDGKPVPEYFSKNRFSLNQINLIVTALGVPMQDILVLTIDDEGKTFYLKKEGRV